MFLQNKLECNEMSYRIHRLVCIAMRNKSGVNALLLRSVDQVIVHSNTV